MRSWTKSKLAQNEPKKKRERWLAHILPLRLFAIDFLERRFPKGSAHEVERPELRLTSTSRTVPTRRDLDLHARAYTQLSPPDGGTNLSGWGRALTLASPGRHSLFLQQCEQPALLARHTRAYPRSSAGTPVTTTAVHRLI